MKLKISLGIVHVAIKTLDLQMKYMLWAFPTAFKQLAASNKVHTFR